MMKQMRGWVLMLMLVLVVGVVEAQTDCPAIVRQALEAVDSACSDTGRNQACYGNILLTAEAQPGVQNLRFEQAGDRANLDSIRSLALSPMDTADNAWGVALLKVQANLPDTEPGANVTMLLFGNVNIGDTLTTESPLAPTATPTPVLLNVTAASNANVRGGPSTHAAIVGSLKPKQTVTANGRNEAGDWLHIQLEDDQTGWVAARLVTVEGDATALPVVSADASAETHAPQYGPLQAFYFKSGADDAPCKEAPDSGILIQTPEGAGYVDLLVNEVEITLGSTIYLQAQPGGYMTVSVVEGGATLRAFGQSQVVPAGSFARVSLDANGAASGAPEAAQPYDTAALQTLPVNLAVMGNITITPALTPDELAAAIQVLGIPAQSGKWTYTSITTAAQGCGPIVGVTFKKTLNFVFNPDGSLPGFTRAGDKTYTAQSSSSTSAPGSGSSTTTATLVINFTSATTFTGQADSVASGAGGTCRASQSLTGEWVSP